MLVGPVSGELARQCVWFCISGPWAISEDKIKSAQEKSPMCLPRVQLLCTAQIGQVFVVRPHHKRHRTTKFLQPVTSLLQRQNQHQQFMVAHVVVSLGR